MFTYFIFNNDEKFEKNYIINLINVAKKRKLRVSYLNLNNLIKKGCIDSTLSLSNIVNQENIQETMYNSKKKYEQNTIRNNL